MNDSIQINDLKFSYKKEEIIIDIPDLRIKKSEKVFIFGSSGSGKSTLLNLMAGVISPTDGEVKILDRGLSKLTRSERDKIRGDHIGYIFQSFNLIPYLTIYENIMLPIKNSKLRSSKVENDFDLEVKRLATHLKIDKYLNKSVTKLSVGQQQRVAVARALIGSPEIIIADEPTSSLDEDVTDSFMKLLLEEHERRKFSLVFVSHDQRLARYFDREISLLSLNKGSIS